MTVTYSIVLQAESLVVYFVEDGQGAVEILETLQQIGLMRTILSNLTLPIDGYISFFYEV